jgi:hypothetical protein
MAHLPHILFCFVLFLNKTGLLPEPNTFSAKCSRPSLNHLHDNHARTNRRKYCSNQSPQRRRISVVSPPSRRNNRVPQIVNAQVAPSEIFSMKLLPSLAWLTAVTALLCSPHAEAQQRAQYEGLVAVHAKANNVPEVLVHRVIVRESKYHPDLVGRGGTIGLMQIKLATARGLGYTGDAAGLRDPETNLAYGVKYLAGAWRAANSDHARAMHYYASGYYYAAKRQRREPKLAAPVLASAPPKEAPKPAEVPVDASK